MFSNHLVGEVLLESPQQNEFHAYYKIVGKSVDLQ